MRALAGATYVRRVYDEGGALRERQVMTLGDLEPDPSDARLLAVPVEITVRRIRLESEETVDPEVGLVHHRLTLMDGGVSIAERVSGR